MVFGDDAEESCSLEGESESQLDSEIYQSDEDFEPEILGNKNVESAQKGDESDEEEEEHMTTARKQWLCCTWCLTWYICNCCLAKCGKMVRKDIQMAWHEKLTLNLIILSLSLAIIF